LGEMCLNKSELKVVGQREKVVEKLSKILGKTPNNKVAVENQV
jgi:hypothetical protein